MVVQRRLLEIAIDYSRGRRDLINLTAHIRAEFRRRFLIIFRTFHIVAAMSVAALPLEEGRLKNATFRVPSMSWQRRNNGRVEGKPRTISEEGGRDTEERKTKRKRASRLRLLHLLWFRRSLLRFVGTRVWIELSSYPKILA